MDLTQKRGSEISQDKPVSPDKRVRRPRLTTVRSEASQAATGQLNWHFFTSVFAKSLLMIMLKLLITQIFRHFSLVKIALTNHAFRTVTFAFAFSF